MQVPKVEIVDGEPTQATIAATIVTQLFDLPTGKRLKLSGMNGNLSAWRAALYAAAVKKGRTISTHQTNPQTIILSRTPLRTQGKQKGQPVEVAGTQGE